LAGLDPAQVQLIEGHGTGTAVGDRVELQVLTDIRRLGSPPAALGSIKANIGHTKAAAGAAGLIKAALAVHHRVLPPTTGCRQPHPLLTQPQAPLRVLAEPERWDGAPARVAAVSSMGFGGINTHIVLRGRAALRPAGRRDSLPPSVRRWAKPAPEHDVLVLEAGSRTELAGLLDRLSGRAMLMSIAEVHDMAATLGHRTGGCAPVRCALVAATGDDLALAAGAASAAATGSSGWKGDLLIDQIAGFVLASGAPARVGLLLPGQAAPVRDQLGELGRLLPNPPQLPVGVHVTVGQTDTAVAQPAVVWQSLAGLALLDALGCEPVAAVGHSLGELTALAWAGCLDQPDVLRLAARRGHLMAERGLADTGMVSLSVGAARAVKLASGTAAVVAALNGRSVTVLAGRRADLDTVLARARREGIAATVLPVSHGFHSPAMRPVVEPWSEALRGVELRAPSRQIISTVTGAPLSWSDDLAGLLVDQLTSPVQFVPAVEQLASRCDLLIEAGPGRMLAGMAADIVSTPVVGMDCGGSGRDLAVATAALVASGAADPAGWFAGRAYRQFDLDTELAFLENPCGVQRVPGQRTRPAGSGEPGQPWAAMVEPVSPVPVARGPLPMVTRSPVEETDLVMRLREQLAADLELPLPAIDAASRLLGDLHLNSLQVAQTVAKVAAAMGRQAPATPLALANVTVAEVAAAVAALPSTVDEPERVDAMGGVRPWVRAFRHDWVPHRPARTGAAADPRDVLTIEIPRHWDVARIAGAMTMIAQRRPARLLLVHQSHPAAAAVGRSAAVELPGTAVTVLDAGEDGSSEPADVGLATETGYLELRRLPDGSLRRLVTALQPLTRSAQPGSPLAAGEVCLVTGGVEGISAYSALVLARASGCTLVVLGRRPADAGPVVAGLASLRDQLGVPERVRYVACDVADEAAVAAAVAAAAGYGAVRGLIHGAGVNAPQRMSAVTAESLAATVRPKVDGLRALLAAAGDGLRLVVGYGSIIGRCGLAGQSEYCIANDWMRFELESWAQRHPACRTHQLEWSVWSEIGMGERLRVLDGLRRDGVEPITPEAGSAMLLDVLAAEPAGRLPVTLLITGRFPERPTLRMETAPAAPLRFADRIRLRVPSVETVIEADLSTASDPYLDEHRVGGVAVLPAVLGMEAMVQAAALTVPTLAQAGPLALTDVDLIAPVTVAEGGNRTVRVAALAEPSQAPGTGTEVAVVLRDDADRFAGDRFTATVRSGPDAAPVPPPRRCFGEPPRLPAQPHPFYGPALFHTGRFQRLIGYRALSAFNVNAWIGADAAQRWFSEFHSPNHLLGDPGAHDATIHLLLPCAPHHRVLPVGVERFSLWRKPDGVLAVTAHERRHTATDYVFDVDLHTCDGTPVASWQGLRLHVVGDNEYFDGRPLGWSLPIELVGPWLSRRLIECGFADVIELAVAEDPEGASDRSAGSLATGLAAALLGIDAENVTFDDSGRLQVPGRHAGISYAEGHVLVALAGQPIGVDWRVPVDPQATDWRKLLRPTGWELAEAMADKAGEEPEYAACRVWSGRHALSALGVGPQTSLRLDAVSEDGLVVTRGDGILLVTARVSTALAAEPMVLAVALRDR
ncbi:MAG TPA: SDR family NAD(P)-dependent oxidoreductase, partial [Pseudonocardiaceae bacterium]|nr:SDR family NAD(P)-dependent oxidoreductase [Pseudonocardiaceae bacterium]